MQFKSWQFRLIACLMMPSFSVLAIDNCKGSRGEIAVCHLKIAYHNRTDWCGHSPEENRNAALCSGIILRAVNLHQKRGHHFFWDIRPTYTGVSFSYLRQDQQFGRLAYGYQAGFIMNPYDHTPAGKVRAELKCSFPFDGDSVNRREFCGLDRDHPESNPCYTLAPPVKTATAWQEHFDNYHGNTESGEHSCGFMLNVKDAREQFRVSMQSRNNYISRHAKAFYSENEIVLAPWNVSAPKQLPIEALFYLKGSSAGLESAKSDQEDFYETTGHQERVPIIRLELPSDPSGEANFAYEPADQKVPDTPSQ